jgi:glutamine amidotransferase PdxT
MAQSGHIIGLTFHPELTPADPRIHDYFLSL